MGTVLDCVCIFQIDITEIHGALRFGVLAASIAFICVRVSMVCFMNTVRMPNAVAKGITSCHLALMVGSPINKVQGKCLRDEPLKR